MTINEAIAHALEVAEQNEKKAKYRPRMDYYDNELESREDCLKHASDLRQLVEWLMELKEAKRLLKSAVEDLRYLESHTVDEEGSCLISDRGERIRCFDCPFYNGGKVNEKCVWNYEAEALKLLGGSGNENH